MIYVFIVAVVIAFVAGVVGSYKGSKAEQEGVAAGLPVEEIENRAYRASVHYF